MRETQQEALERLQKASDRAEDTYQRLAQSEIDSHERRFLYYHSARDKLLVALSAGAIGISFTLIITTTIQQQTKSLIALSWLLFAANIIFTIIGHQLNTIGYKGLFKYVSRVNTATKDDDAPICPGTRRNNAIVAFANFLYYVAFAAFFAGLILFSWAGYNTLFCGG